MPDQRRPRESRNGQPQPPPPSNKRLSITDRLLGKLGHAGRDASISVQRRASSVSTRSSPIPRIREWLDVCNAQHGRHCSGEDDDTQTLTWRPVRFVDVVERCLVRAKPTDRYTALSYVWGVTLPRKGPDAAAQLLKSNVDAYELGLPEVGIPKTILDAMWLSKKLGIRHLWVDRLCIIQDDQEDRSDHVQHMGHLFANAYLTIVAAHGDVSTGLLPLDPRRPLRPGRPASIDHEELLLNSPWQNRCWTLQEQFYSRRAVCFSEDIVTWQCHCEIWQSDTANAINPARGRRHDCVFRVSSALLGFQHAPWPDLEVYACLVMEFSARKLTLTDDTLAAFSGIVHILSRVFSGGFVYGMPLLFLDAALLWRPQATIRRRALSRPPFLPSWSWMGWWYDGIPVDLLLWRAAADYVGETLPTKRGPNSKRFQARHSFRVKPIIKWSLTNRVDSVTIDNGGFQFRELRSRKNVNTPLPPGWSRIGSHVKHESDDLTLFKYPVPVLEPVEEADYERQEDKRQLPGPLLAFSTRSGFFDVNYAISIVSKDKPSPPIAVGNIWSTSRRWVGEFRAHDGWLGVQSSNYDGEEKLEFLAISSAMERRGSYVFSKERFEENMDEDEVIDIVNVLWIERIGGIAYRRGLGHILQGAWDAQARDEADFLLG